MDGQRATEQDRRALQRIASLLLALADLAIRAAGMPPFVRHLVLWLLRHGEAVAAGYVSDTALDFGFLVELPDPDSPQGSTPEDVMRLAQSFHALAQTLLHLLALFPDTMDAASRHERRYLARLAPEPRRRPRATQRAHLWRSRGPPGRAPDFFMPHAPVAKAPACAIARARFAFVYAHAR